MNWVVVGPSRLRHRLRRLARQIDAATVQVSAPGWALPAHADGIVFHGTDHELARLAVTTSAPIAHVPVRGSDLGRMFAVAGTDHVATGSPYPADMGFLTAGANEVPFVAHAVFSRTGRLPGALARRAVIGFDRSRGSEQRRAAALVVANAQHVAGYTVAPRSALMDGVADLQTLGSGGWMRRRGRLLRRGLHQIDPGSHRTRVSSVDIVPPSRWKVRVDGVLAGEGPCTIRIEQARFTLWV